MSAFFSHEPRALSHHYRRMLTSYIVYKRLSPSHSFKLNKFIYPQIRLTLIDRSGDTVPSPDFALLSSAFFKQIFFQNHTYTKFSFEGESHWAATSLSGSKFRGFPLMFFSSMPTTSSRRLKHLGFDSSYGFRFSILDVFGFFGADFFNYFRLDFFDFRVYLVVDVYTSFMTNKNFKPYLSMFKIYPN